MATLLAESPPSPQTDAPAPNGAAPGTPPVPAPETPVALAHTCKRCGAPLAEGQDWCTNCGAGAPGALSGTGWRPAAGVLIGVVALLLVAAAAAYAALKKSEPKRPATVTIARVAPPAAPPAASTPTTVVPTTPTTIKAPKIPLATPTPKIPAVKPVTPSGGTSPSTGGESESESSSTSTSTTKSESTGEASKPSAILLDTNAASTYNPYALPASYFGDPSLAIDGEPATGWTAQVDPATAPRMAVGLLVDFKTQRRVGSVEVITSTPGMTIQIYGANGTAVPTTITARAWHQLQNATKMAKKHESFKLKDSAHSYRWITLWISRAPAASVGTPTAPGHVSVNEIELFPPA